MTRSDQAAGPTRSIDERARVVVAGASSLDAFAELAIREIERWLPADLAALRIGTTSIAPRDEAARATRWVSRLASRREIAATVASPSGSPAAPSLGAIWWPLRARPRGQEARGVGVSRLDLSPVMAAVDQPYAVGLWLPLSSSPRRTQSEPGVELIEAARAARPLCTLLVGGVGGMTITIVGGDLLACEVLARAVRAAAQPVGDRGLSPWEAPVVQRGIELGAGVTHPDRIAVDSVWLGAPADPRHDRFHRVVAVAMARAGIPA